MQESVVYNLLLWTVFISGAFVFIVLLFIKAPYGRHYREGWGIETSPSLGWMVMESPAVLVMAFLFITGNPSDIAKVVFFLIWMTHYIQRTFVYPLLMQGTKKKFPIILMVFALFFNSINAYLNGRYLFHLSPVYGLQWLGGIRFILGFLLFAAGICINIHSDSILRSLRKDNNDEGYSIPQRGLFRYVSNPNYLGEMLEWIGWAVLTWSLAGLAFAWFTIANLLPRALSNHQWYKKQFSDYPDDRKVLFPFIF